MVWWVISLLAVAPLVGAKVLFTLFRLAPDPPKDRVAARHWRRRRLGLAYAELLATPSFATAGVAITRHFKLTAETSVGISMILGAIGFTLLLDGIQYLFRLRIGMAQPAPTPEITPTPAPEQGEG